MSIPGNPHAPDWYTPEYNTQVRLIYQAKGYALKGCTTPPVKIDGDVNPACRLIFKELMRHYEAASSASS